MTLECALSGDPVPILEGLMRGHVSGLPAEYLVDYQPIPPPADWMALVRQGKRPIQFEWRTPLRRVLVEQSMVLFTFEEMPRQVQPVIELLAALPFEIASFATIHPSWRGGSNPYYAPAFGDGHLPHGWACAFRGRGHDRLVSPRWLPAGPWQLHRDEDMSFVQFHDLALDAEAALAVARPAHARMGITPEGGFIARPHLYEHDLSGYYRPEQRLIKVLVSRRDVSSQEMLDASAAVHEQAFGPARPIESVAFVFMEEDRARRHLRELWLHGLQCHAIIKGTETRLDGRDEPG